MFFVFKQKTAYELRISDWSSDVCSSDLGAVVGRLAAALAVLAGAVLALVDRALGAAPEIDPEAAVDLVLRRKALGHGGAIPFFRAMPARLSRRPCCSGRPRERSCPDSSGRTGRTNRPFRPPPTIADAEC